MKIIPTQGVAQYSHRSACVLRTEEPGRHSTQTRTQASPAVAESEARLAIGLQVVDNPGPAAAESEFAASVMRQLRRPIRLCSRQMSRWMTTMKFAQDSCYMLAHSQRTVCRVVDFGINTTAPAVGLSRVPQKTKKKLRYASYGTTLQNVPWLCASTQEESYAISLWSSTATSAVNIA